MLPADFESWLQTPHRAPLLMGVLNLTPDSFSDGGKFADPRAARSHIQEMIAAGAAIIDIGAESTRPGSQSISEDEQIRRLLPLLKQLANLPATFSIDTTRAAVASVALDHGATIINDISAGRDDPTMLPLAAQRNCAVILMHMQGAPATMQTNPQYSDVVSEVYSFFEHRLAAAASAGIAPHHQLIDPGLGFGKSFQHNLALLRHLTRFSALGRPIVLGASRKGFIGKLINEPDPLQRTYGTAATIAFAATNGAAILRVHDVKPMHQVLDVITALADSTENRAVSE